jgi:hypothetical protein
MWVICRACQSANKGTMKRSQTSFTTYIFAGTMFSMLQSSLMLLYKLLRSAVQMILARLQYAEQPLRPGLQYQCMI